MTVTEHMLSPPPELAPNRFRLIVPITSGLTKSKATKTDERWLIEGIASSENRDLQNEIVVQKGINFKPLLESGFFNWNHMEGPENIVGIPLEIKIIKGPRLYVKGELLKNVTRAKAIYDLAKAFEAFNAQNPDGPSRRLAWSIEGEKVQMKDEYIEECVVDQLAITHEPVNPFTWLQLVKSLRGAQMGKTMSYANDSQLKVQNLDDNVTSFLWGACTMGHYDKTTYKFRGGTTGAIDHLVRCRGLKPQEARDLLIRLRYAY